MANKEILANYEKMKNECFETRKLNDNLGELVVEKNRIIADLEDKLANADYQLEGRDNEIRELKDEVRKLKLLVSSLVYEINQIWDINEMNDDLRVCAEKIDREVQLSKMAEDNRMVISALGFAIVPPKPKLDVKEV
jgi:chromosome segregation ATPase